VTIHNSGLELAKKIKEECMFHNLNPPNDYEKHKIEIEIEEGHVQNHLKYLNIEQSGKSQKLWPCVVYTELNKKF